MKPKILFILHTPPPVHGAAMVGKYIKESTRINGYFKTRYINLGTSRSFDDIGRGGLQKIFRFFGLLWEVLIQMILFRPDKVYLTLTAKGNGFYKDAVVVFLVKIMGGQMIYHFHNKGVKTRQDKALDHWLYKKVFYNAHVILLSQYLYPDVQKYVPRVRVHICPNGIPDIFDDAESENNVSNKERVYILFLSNLLETKGVYELLEACKYLKERKLPFACTFVGGEANISASELRQKIEILGLEKYVTYAGKKYNEEKKKIFRASDVFVFPTYYETFGLVNLEAMQAQLPVISTPEGGIPDVVEDGKTGYLVPQKDAKALADKLEELIKDPQKRKKMGRKGYEKYRKVFTLQAFEERLTHILQKVCAKQ